MQKWIRKSFWKNRRTWINWKPEIKFLLKILCATYSVSEDARSLSTGWKYNWVSFKEHYLKLPQNVGNCIDKLEAVCKLFFIFIMKVHDENGYLRTLTFLLSHNCNHFINYFYTWNLQIYRMYNFLAHLPTIIHWKLD